MNSATCSNPEITDLVPTVDVFVYGTLKSKINESLNRNNRFHSHLREFVPTMKEAVLSKNGYFFEIIQGGGAVFPVVTFDTHAVCGNMTPQTIHGELYTLPNYMMRILQNIEGSYFDEHICGVTTLKDGNTQPATVYIGSKIGLLDQIEQHEVREITDGIY